MDRQVDLVIIGAGPGGMTAALYASRAGLRTLMLDASAPGGKLLKTYLIDNYPGLPETPGPDLAIQMYQQSVAFGAAFETGEVETVNADKQVILKNGDVIDAKAVIIATGTKERLLSVPGEQEAIGHGESFCAVCDGAFFRNKEVVVIGGGNSALEESLFLTKFASKVTIVIRRDEFRAERRVQQQVQENDKIHVIKHHVVSEVKMTEGKVSAVVLENVETKDHITIPCQGLFPYIGSVPETSMVKDLGITDANGCIEVNEQMETAVKGIYAVGDCIQKELRQVVTAAGDGAVAAQAAFHFVTGI
ncbi:MAG: FAD-dependent oxidoreductase [Erysipelotrichaceae bacterium]|nr:FAD-dependent oxidoreductase [Erysipelotrichaceae bacterium]